MRALLCVLFVLAATIAAADSRVDELVAAGKFEEAVAALTSALETAPTPDARIETIFALARAHEQWATADPPRSEEHYQDALRLYARLWLDEPRRPDAEAAARNNCAQIYAALGQDGRASELFAAASAIDDPMRSFYLANFAEFLAARGQKDAAITNYEQALALQPGDVVIQAKLLQLYDGARVAKKLWELVGANELERAQRLALDHLGRDLDETTKRDLLSIVAVTLARQHRGPDDFEPVNARLGALIEDASIRDGIKELRRLYDGAALDEAAYPWWKVPGPQRTVPALEPPLAFSALACELGDQMRVTSAPKAESYYKLAIAVSHDLDPDPYVSLAEFYYGEGRLAELRTFFDQRRMKLMEMKGAALRSGDWQAVYRFHVALGTIYSRLAVDKTDTTWAIYHLENARIDARELSAATSTSVLLDPRSVDLLAANYAKAEPQSGRDLKLRLDTAEEYVESGRTKSAESVLQPVVADPRVQQGEDKVRFDKLKTRVALPNTTPVDPAKTHVGTTTTTRPDELKLRVPAGVPLDDTTRYAIAKLLSEYFIAAPSRQREIQTQLGTLGVSDIRRDAAGAGALVLRRGATAATIPFEVQEEPRVPTQKPPEPKPVEVRLLLAGVRLDRGVTRNLQKLLSDYYSAREEMRPDFEAKLRGFGVTNIRQPVAGKGAVALKNEGGTVTIEFELKPRE